LEVRAGAGHPASMKRLLLLSILLLRTATAADFWTQLTPAERAAAGIEQLTPAQQATLDQLAARYAKEGARQAVEVVKAEARQETVAAVQQARQQAKEEAQGESRQRKIANAGLAARDDDEAIRTRIVGDFRGWTGNTVFRLENGQSWQQADKENRFFPKQTNPEVELIPSAWAGWKLKIVSEGLWVKVKRLH
jgi:hypothetical protein